MNERVRDLTKDELDAVGGGVFENIGPHINVGTCTKVRTLVGPIEGAYLYSNTTSTACW